MLAALMSDEPFIWPAALAAVEMVESGMVVGLGTGRAAAMFVRALAERVTQDGLSVRGVPTSIRTAELAEELKIPLTTLDEVASVDIDVDGADEVDPNLDLIKGHGGALLRERVVASVSERFVVLVGDEKIVKNLGERVSVPIEVVPFAAPVVRRKLESLGFEVELRSVGETHYRSDNGNYILDARFERIASPSELEELIVRVPGVVDSGLFIGMADVVFVQSEGAFRKMERA
jgi:ribose 5-phosphate isomerase A